MPGRFFFARKILNLTEVFYWYKPAKIKRLQAAGSAVDIAVAADAAESCIKRKMIVDKARAHFYIVLPGIKRAKAVI